MSNQDQLAPGILSLTPLSYIKPTFLVDLDIRLWLAMGNNEDSPERTDLDYLISVFAAKRELDYEDTLVVTTITTQNSVLKDQSATETPKSDLEAFQEIIERSYGAFESHDRQILSLKSVINPDEASSLYIDWLRNIANMRLARKYPIS